MTYEEILTRALSRVPNSYDKREGSVIRDAISPVCYELAKMYEGFESALRNTFAGTADRNWLVKRCAEIGISPISATYAVRKATFTPASLDIPLGERFYFEKLNFYVTEKISDGLYLLTCEEAGEVGNFGEGNLLPINYINGLQRAYLESEVAVYGEDEEDTETLRQRYFDTLPTMTLDGNIAQYQKWCREYEGIGNYKIFPEWAGKNTVKVSVLSAENTVASDVLIDDFQEYLDPDSEGLGMGKAPIGAVVTVTTATPVVVDVVCRVTMRTGYEATITLENDIREYLKGLNYVRDRVSYVAITSLVQNEEATDYVFEVLLNGASTDIPLGNEEIAEFGSLTVEVV